MKRISSFLFVFIIFISFQAFCPTNGILDRAVTLYKWKYYDDAIVELNKMILEGKEPWASRASFLKGYCFLKKGGSEQAKEIFRSLAVTPDFVLYDHAKFALAEICFNEKDYESAYLQYKGFFADSALKPEADLKLAESLYMLGRVDEAIAALNELVAAKGPGAPLDRARFNLGRYYEKVGDFKNAMKSYRDISLYHPLSPVWRQAMARITYLTRNYKIYPGEASAEDLFNKGMVYYNFGDFGSASVTFQQIVSAHRSSGLWQEALFKLAMCDYKRKRLSSSITRFKLCASGGGDLAAASQFYMAFAYGKRGYFYQALDSLNKVVLNYPNSEYADDAAYWLAYYYESNGYKDTAEQYYRNFVAQYPNSEFTDDAYWKLGRIYYFKKDYAAARDTFKTALDRCPDASMLDACSYWLGLCSEKIGNSFDAVNAYQTVVQKFDHTYYSYRAREKLYLLGAETFDYENVRAEAMPVAEESAKDMPINEEPFPFEAYEEDYQVAALESPTIKTTDLRDHFNRYTELMAVGFYEDAALEASLLVENSPKDKKISAKLALATAQMAAGKVRDSITYAEILCNNAILNGTSRDLPRQTWNLAYPKGYYKHVSEYAAQFGLEEALVLAVIREESRFNPKTLSWANARGLMQIIPQTGLGVARLVGIKSYRTAQLFEPEMNIKLGCYYLAQLLKRFGGNKIYALAAYNGGPIRVKKWMNKWQSDIGSSIDMDEFVESIPLAETRRYVQKVLKSYYEYKRLYTNQYPVLKYKV